MRTTTTNIRRLVATALAAGTLLGGGAALAGTGTAGAFTPPAPPAFDDFEINPCVFLPESCYPGPGPVVDICDDHPEICDFTNPEDVDDPEDPEDPQDPGDGTDPTPDADPQPEVRGDIVRTSVAFTG